MKTSGQPLSYQQQSASCWITSVMNGMVSLLGSASKVPNEMARIIYAISSKDGTDLKEAGKVASFINAYNINIKCSLVRGADVSPEELLKALDRKGVVVADIHAGEHSVLVTGHADGKYQIFDPNWENIKKGRRGRIKNAEFPNSAPNYNVIVSKQELFALSTKPHSHSIRMGARATRCLFIMERRK